jgi:hypothetical protein
LTTTGAATIAPALILEDRQPALKVEPLLQQQGGRCMERGRLVNQIRLTNVEKGKEGGRFGLFIQERTIMKTLRFVMILALVLAWGVTPSYGGHPGASLTPLLASSVLGQAVGHLMGPGMVVGWPPPPPPPPPPWGPPPPHWGPPPPHWGPPPPPLHPILPLLLPPPPPPPGPPPPWGWGVAPPPPPPPWGPPPPWRRRW